MKNQKNKTRKASPFSKRFHKRASSRAAALLASALLAAAGIGWTSGCSRQDYGISRIPASEPIRQESSDPAVQNVSDQTAFDHLTDEIFRENAGNSLIDLHFSIAEPENYGITQAKSLYGEISLASAREDLEQMKQYQTRLQEISRQKLSKESQLDYAIFEQYLETELSLEGLESFIQPLAPTIGIQAQLPVLLAEYAFYDQQDVEDYFSLLAGLDDYFGQILELEQEKARLGQFMTDGAIDRVLDSCQPYLESKNNCVLNATFEDRLNQVPGLTENQKSEYTKRHDELIADAFLPAYQHLTDGLEALKGSSTAEGGLCSFPDGKDYYRYLVFSSTQTSCKNIHNLQKTIEKRLDEEFDEIRRLLKAEPELLKRYDEAAFTLTDPQEILNYLQKAAAQDFPEPICRDYTLHYVPEALEPVLSPAFYLTPPMDRPTSNTIYINRGSIAGSEDQLFSTLAHEGYPGHLYQTSYFIQQNPAPFRHLLSFPGYSEGWATYVESLSYQMDSGLNGSLGRLMALNSTVNLGIHAYIDIMVNDQGWKIPEISRYISQYFDDPDQEYAKKLYEAMIDNPTNYLEYYVGYLEFSDMRQKTEKTLGKKFEAKEFHQFLLDIGPAPFTVIREELENWINEKKK